MDTTIFDILNRERISKERPKEALIDFTKRYDEKFKYVPSLRSIWEVKYIYIQKNGEK